MGKKKSSRRKAQKTIADQVDRHRLYEYSVQSPDSEIAFVRKQFKRLTGRLPKVLREDFCGTAGVCCAWVRKNKEHKAIGVDIDRDVLRWSRENNISRLKPGHQARIRLLNKDVLKVRTEPVDVVSAMNFSYWLFMERDTLKRYFRSVRRSLASDGVFFLDAFGGYDAFRELEEEREVEVNDTSFTYIWDQASFNPIDNRMQCYIHFSFEDDSRLDRAFSYRWRLWTLPELRELLEETGFRDVTFYWQGFDKDGEADGRFRKVTRAEADAGWICYITARK
jgi:SAM-dependent methyltransferase